MQILISTILSLLFTNSVVLGQKSVDVLQHKIETGNFHNLRGEFEASISNVQNNKEKSELYQLYGSYYRLKGDLDLSFEYWKKSNLLRKQIYKKNDFHLAWNHALNSSYYYEKFNVQLSSLYADSCSYLIKDLTINQKKEINIHLIYNIIAQSYKQNSQQIPFYEMQRLYHKIQEYYLSSIDFQLNNKLPKHDLAKTYHLLANSYTDLASRASQKENANDIHLYYKKANEYYSKADDIWSTLYGNLHYERGRTYFVRGLLNYKLSKYDSKYEKLADYYFQAALDAFGVDKTNTHKSLKKVPNKSSLLMCYKYLTLHKLAFSKLNKSSLLEIQDINNQACFVWKEIIKSNSSKNKSQNLAIYNLNPYDETISILLEKEKIGEKLDKNLLFEATQYLKNFDVVLSREKSNAFNYSLVDFQKSLSKDDLFIDVQTIGRLKSMVISFISKSRFETKYFPILNHEEINTLRKAILDLNYSEYCRLGSKWFNIFFEGINISNKNITICTDAAMTNFPYEALLYSNDNVEKGDYRKLDYLIKHNDIQFTLNSKLLTSELTCVPFSISAFAPEVNKNNLALLPFSKSLVEQLNLVPHSKGYSGSAATKNNFLNLNSTILHLSGHGIIDENQSYFSKLMFSGGELSLEDVKFKNQTPTLAVINTCNSSLGKMYFGDGLNSFERLLAIEGVHSILSNIWEVDDYASNEIMKLFYANLMKSYSNNLSLKEAKLAYITSSKNSNLAAPYYWAGHRLSGHDNIFEIEKSKFIAYLSVFGAGLILSILLYFKFKKQ